MIPQMGGGVNRLQLPAHLTGLSVAELRALSPLPEDAQRVVDSTVVSVGLERLVFVADLLAEGLTFPLPNPMSVTEVQWDKVTKTGHAIRTMSPEARGEYQLPNRTSQSVPVYLTMDDFSLNIRTFLASQRIGLPLDTSMIAEATRRVNESIEDAAINGAGVVVGGNSTPGLLDLVGTNAYAISTSWLTATGAVIVANVLAMIALNQAVGRYGPFNLYVPTAVGNRLNENYSDGVTTFPVTIQQRLEQIQAGGRTIRVRTADRLPATKVALVQMTNDVVDVIDGQRPTSIPWTSPSGFTLFWAVMAIQIPRFKTDVNGATGITIGTMP